MDKSAAVAIVKARRASKSLGRAVSFANVCSGKPVWWLELPRKKVFDRTTPHVDLVLADNDAGVHHLRVPKEWLVENIDRLAKRESKDVIVLELSTLSHERFRDVRPRSGRLNFAIFLVE